MTNEAIANKSASGWFIPALSCVPFCPSSMGFSPVLARYRAAYLNANERLGFESIDTLQRCERCKYHIVANELIPIFQNSLAIKVCLYSIRARDGV